MAAATGQTMVTMTVAATPAGYQQLLELAGQHHRQRVWAIESTGGYGAGLTRFLAAHAEQVVELDRPRLRRDSTTTTNRPTARHQVLGSCLAMPATLGDTAALMDHMPGGGELPWSGAVR